MKEVIFIYKDPDYGAIPMSTYYSDGTFEVGNTKGFYKIVDGEFWWQPNLREDWVKGIAVLDYAQEELDGLKAAIEFEKHVLGR